MPYHLVLIGRHKVTRSKDSREPREFHDCPPSTQSALHRAHRDPPQDRSVLVLEEEGLEALRKGSKGTENAEPRVPT